MLCRSRLVREALPNRESQQKEACAQHDEQPVAGDESAEFAGEAAGSHDDHAETNAQRANDAESTCSFHTTQARSRLADWECTVGPVRGAVLRSI